MAQGNHKMNRYMSVSQVVAQASNPFFDDFYPPKMWLRSADAMVKQASIYEHEGDLQTAYFILYRHASLIVEHLPNHPLAKDPEIRQQMLEARRSARTSLAKMEELKPRINRRHERHQEKLKTAAALGKQSRDSLESERRSGRRDSAQEQYQLDALEHQDVAVEVATRELGKRKQNQLRRTSINDDSHDDNLSAALLNTGHYLSQSSRRESSQAHQHSLDHRSSNYNYPSISAPHAAPAETNGQASYPARTTSTNLPSPLVPRRPPKDAPSHDLSRQQPDLSPQPPLVPIKAPIQPHRSQSPSSSRPTTPTPVPQFAPRPTLESSQPLRPIFLPGPLRHHFLRAASANTSLNRETLALLAGTLRRGAFFITHLLLPPQTATSDTCEMTAQGEMLLDQFISERSAPDRAAEGEQEPAPRPGYDGEDLMLLGWIHTHPTQTCFLSSRDLHTHVWYQSSLPEAIAIVCAPSRGDWGAFRLTDPPGVGVVRVCKREGVFHLHDESEGGLYTDVVGGKGHVIEVEQMDVEVVDLRDVKGA